VPSFGTILAYLLFRDLRVLKVQVRQVLEFWKVQKVGEIWKATEGSGCSAGSGGLEGLGGTKVPSGQEGLVGLSSNG
jgi:hypothetical protein